MQENDIGGRSPKDSKGGQDAEDPVSSSKSAKGWKTKTARKGLAAKRDDGKVSGQSSLPSQEIVGRPAATELGSKAHQVPAAASHAAKSFAGLETQKNTAANNAMRTFESLVADHEIAVEKIMNIAQEAIKESMQNLQSSTRQHMDANLERSPLKKQGFDKATEPALVDDSFRVGKKKKKVDDKSLDPRADPDKWAVPKKIVPKGGLLQESLQNDGTGSASSLGGFPITSSASNNSARQGGFARGALSRKGTTKSLDRITTKNLVGATHTHVTVEELHKEAVAHTVFADEDDMKHALMANIALPTYHVEDFYQKTGIWQAIARSTWFEYAASIVIGLNLIWTAVDVDHNEAELLVEADLMFVIADNIFCFLFVMEWGVRLGAFQVKRNGLKDSLFIFDGVMCGLTITETWALSAYCLIVGIDQTNSMLVNISGYLKILRMARTVRILKAIPEMMVVIRGVFTAARSVSAALVLLMFLVYVFAIALTELMDGTAMGHKYFPDVTFSVRFLLLAAWCPDLVGYVEDVWAEGVGFALVFLLFILVGAITIMNMVIGILVGVMHTVAILEKEEMLIEFAKNTVLNILQGGVEIMDENGELQVIDSDQDGCISKPEFDSLLNLPEAVSAFEQMGVDAVGLGEYADFIFAEKPSLTLQEFMEMVMHLRGANLCTVKDIVDLRHYIVKEIHLLHAELADVMGISRPQNPRQSGETHEQ